MKKLGGALGKEWAKKWVTLTEAQLSFAEDETGSANRKIVPLNAVSRVLDVEEAEGKHGRQHVFEVEVKDQKPKAFQAGSAREAREWAAAVTQLAAFGKARITRDRFSTNSVGDVWADMPGEFMYKPKSELTGQNGQSFSREFSKLFGGNKWPARWVWTADRCLMYARTKGAEPEKTVSISNLQLCTAVDSGTMRDMQAPEHLWDKAFELLTEDRRILFACETRVSRDKWVAYLEDAMYSTSEEIAVSKASPMPAKKAKQWMDAAWDDDEWDTWQQDSLAKWDDEEVDVHFETDLLEETFVREGEKGDEWPEPDGRGRHDFTHAWAYEDSFATEMTVQKGQLGKWDSGFSVDHATLRVSSSGMVDGVSIDNARIAAVAGNNVHSAAELRHYLDATPKGGVVVLRVIPCLFTNAEYFSGETDRARAHGVDMARFPPLTKGVRSPFPMLACLDFTPQQLRERMHVAREKSKEEKAVLHQQQQEMRKQRAEASDELGERTKATFSYASHAASRTLSKAMANAKQKAGTTYTAKLAERAGTRFRERFPELSGERVICNYKCLMRFADPKCPEAIDLDAHIMVTSKRLCYYNGGRADVSFRGWIPHQCIASIQCARLHVDPDTYKRSYRTLDWLEEDDISGAEALQVFTTLSKCYTFIKVRAISLEKAKPVDGVVPTDGLLSYLDNAWREVQTEIPVPGYDYLD
eukprot:TRINITY_DN33020_c0_g1_i1.p1 TRINITY_DN33020_c0_g1~~TRINITY_DN33020_c0_g1_i1.p1  ORF type:complete len:734 (+),score=261.34 TRINITY_DN33020_c0_g1_i1:107-2203(+)